MPKGALLHSHFDATVDTSFLLKIALKEPAMHVRVIQPLTTKNIGSILPEFSARPAEFHNFEGPSLTSENYRPNIWLNIAKAREMFGLGGPEAFDKWVINAMMIQPAEAYGTHNTVDKVPSLFAVFFAL